MTSEDLQSEALARWLEGRGGTAGGPLGAPPEELDEDVVEAVYALRPDLAPAPRVTIEEILATLDQAPELARFLDGEQPHVALDPDVSEAVYALSPGRAPGPKVSIDDILSRVQSGPLASSPPPVADEDPEEQLAEVVPFPQRPPPPEPVRNAEPATAPDFRRAKRPTPWWPWLVSSGAAGVLAAALAALVILPQGASSPAYEEAPASAPADEIVAAESPRGETIAGAPSPAAKAQPAPPPAPPATPTMIPEVVAQAPAERRLKAKREAEPELDAVADAEPTVAALEQQQAGEAFDDDAVAFGDEIEEEAEHTQFSRELSADQADGVFGGRAVAGTSGPPQATSGYGAEVVSESKRSRPGRKSAASNSYAPAPEEMAEASAPAAASAPAPSARDQAWSAPASPPSLDALDAATRDRIRALEAEAEALLAQGQYRGAADLLARAIVAPSEVGQWYAAQSASLYLQAGDPGAAVTTAERGLALGGRSPALLRIYGDALAAAGLSTAAEQAWEEAAR